MALSPFEEFIATYWWQLGIILVSMIAGFLKLDSINKLVEEHHSPNNPAPHPSCAVHSQMLEGMDKKLDRIEERQLDVIEAARLEAARVLREGSNK